MASSIRVVILGDHKVGKSAVTVRFLTKRFIGEYSSDIDLLYRSSIKGEDSVTDIEVLDTCTKPGQPVKVEETRVSWADAFVVVYSILSRPSFHAARVLIQGVNRIRTSAYMPIMLLGNKTDLDPRREVGVDEGHQVALEHGCQYFEVSAAENVGITLAFQAFLREARIVQHQKTALLKRRRSSLASMSKRLGAMFGKNKDSSNSNHSNSSGSGGGYSGGISGGYSGGHYTGGGGDGAGGRRGSIDVRDLREMGKLM
ncbi:ras-related and estrogen-regulated growth inhibitor-like protein [Aplysia californica]|uniref:small monomeric GTPase n=1 Tax=Aplysia californica TaxID=6500 RepID=A0ABM1VU58_APLCA|nr:ras-related and estrogen-regulated growth inhibitor-like protein [Aplysia californica]